MILLDSNAFLWLLYYPEKVGSKALSKIEIAGGVRVSALSIWGLAIKYNLGKLPYNPEQLSDGVVSLGASLLELSPRQIVRLEGIGLPQKDPFDRMLVAQAQAEGLTFATSDKNILASKYDILDITK